VRGGFGLKSFTRKVCGAGLAALAGCASPGVGPSLAPVPQHAAAPRQGAHAPQAAVRQVAHAEPAAPVVPPERVEDFVRLALDRNPRLARAELAIEAARGRHQQAGLYPNPELAVNWDELGDRSSPDRLGILTAPKFTQTLVTGRKLTLAQAVAAREVDRATLDLLDERFEVAAAVRAAFYEAHALQERVARLSELVKLAEAAVTNGKALLDAKQIAQLDLLQLEVERERLAAEQRAAQKELPGAYRKLAAVAGDSSAIPALVKGTFDGLPDYDAEAARAAVLAYHPRARAARVDVERARAAVARAEAEPIPNVTVYAGYVRQFENRSNDGSVGVSVPVPVWNKNQGAIRAARAELGMAIRAVGQTENELAGRVAAAHQAYASARERVAVYQKELLPRAEEALRLSSAAFKGGQFEYLRVIQAQRAVAEARLELNKALAEAWRAAAELSGLLLEEIWPEPPR